jgi:hypothetical protein
MGGAGEMMPKRTNRMAWGLSAGLSVILAAVVVMHARDILCYVLGLPIYRVVDYNPGLTRQAATAKPVIAALNHYHRQHGRFPAAVSQLAPYLPSELATPAALKRPSINGWHYSKYENGKICELVRWLGRDPMLCYEFKGSEGHWTYDNGDGSPRVPIRLNP